MKIKYALIAAVLLVAATVTSVKALKESTLLFEANVEALADGEDWTFGPMCSKTGTPGNYYMKYCKNCRGSYGKYAMDVVAFC